MKTISLGKSPLLGSRLAYGCWRIAETSNPSDAPERGRASVHAALEAGYTLFDHADIYSDGMGETIFGAALREIPGARDRVLIASKCGIRKSHQPKLDSPYRYDFSASYLIESCEQSLRRLQVGTIDLYQLHRPDYLMDPDEVAAAFSELKRAGKVREFGVSNFRPSQVTALQKACPMRLLVNQVEISLAQLSAFETGLLDHCLVETITPMAWSPLAGGLLADGARRLLASQESYQCQPILTELDILSRAHGVSRSVVALAWLLKHPSGIVPIVGSTSPASIVDAAQASGFELSREEWYRLLEAARGMPLP